MGPAVESATTVFSVLTLTLSEARRGRNAIARVNVGQISAGNGLLCRRGAAWRGWRPPRGQMLEELVGVGLWPRRVEAGLRTERTVDDRRHESIEAGPRRHGAARRARAREAQRARILAAMTETAGTKGYRAARVADVLERAGLSTSEFYSLFAGKAEVGLRALVESLAERPAAARTVMIEVRVSGDRGEGRHVEALSSLTYLIGGPRSAWQADGAHEVARMVAEGLADMIASEAIEAIRREGAAVARMPVALVAIQRVNLRTIGGTVEWSRGKARPERCRLKMNAGLSASGVLRVGERGWSAKVRLW